MTDLSYPTFEELNCAPDFLLIGANAMHNLRARGYLSGAVAHERAVPQARRNAPLLPYVGVSRRYNGYAANYRTADGKWSTASVRASAYEAALDRARILGRDWIEMRGET